MTYTIKTGKQKIAYWIFMQKYRFTTGKDKTFGWAASLVSEALLAVVLMNQWGYDVRKAPLVLVGIAAFVFVFFWGLGIFYMRYELDKVENIVQQERNPFMDNLHKKVIGEDENGRD